MSACDRFEREALLLIEQGLPLEEHFRSCRDCLSAAAVYARLKEALPALDDGAPPEGWDDTVREGINLWERGISFRDRQRIYSWERLLAPRGEAPAVNAARAPLPEPKRPLSDALDQRRLVTLRWGVNAQRRRWLAALGMIAVFVVTLVLARGCPSAPIRPSDDRQLSPSTRTGST